MKSVRVCRVIVQRIGTIRPIGYLPARRKRRRTTTATQTTTVGRRRATSSNPNGWSGFGRVGCHEFCGERLEEIALCDLVLAIVCKRGLVARKQQMCMHTIKLNCKQDKVFCFTKYLLNYRSQQKSTFFLSLLIVNRKDLGQK